MMLLLKHRDALLLTYAYHAFSRRRCGRRCATTPQRAEPGGERGGQRAGQGRAGRPASAKGLPAADGEPRAADRRQQRGRRDGTPRRARGPVVLVDANILLYAVDEASPFHERASNWLTERLNGDRRVAFPWLSLLAFLRNSTTERAAARPPNPDAGP